MSALDDQIGGSHYRNMAIQPAEFCEKNDIPYLFGTAIAYLARAGKKPGEPIRKDVLKARHILDLWLEMNPEMEDNDIITPTPFERAPADGVTHWGGLARHQGAKQ